MGTTTEPTEGKPSGRPTNEKKRMGRPSDYTPEKGQRICDLLMLGRSLRSICLEDGMPHLDTALRWVLHFEDFRANYVEARKVQADILVDEIVDIADDNSNDIKTVARGDELVQIVDSDVIQRARLRVDSRKWIAGKLLPKKYGEIHNLNMSGPDGGPIRVQTEIRIDPETTKLIARLLTDAKQKDLAESIPQDNETETKG